MNRERALVLGGIFSSRKRLEDLANEVASQLYEHVEVFTWPEGLRHLGPDGSYSIKDLQSTTAIPHSFGVAHLREARGIIALAPPEPIHPVRVALRAGRVALNARSDMSDAEVNLREGIEEVLRNPDHFRVLGRTARYSAITQLYCCRDKFPEGVIYLPPKRDQLFGDGHIAAMALAERMAQRQDTSITAQYVGTGHTYALDHPRETVMQIKEIFETSPQQTTLESVVA